MIKLLDFIRENWVALTLIALAGITLLSLWPLKELPAVPGTDKTLHLIAYAVLMFPTALRKPKKWIFFGFSFIAYSGIIELIQPYVNRSGDWLDWGANATGVACGLIGAELIKYIFPIAIEEAEGPGGQGPE